MSTNFFVRPGENERIETRITLTPDERSILHGTVTDTEGRPVIGAIAMLMEKNVKDDVLQFVSSLLTDDDGQFYFGPLTSGSLYIVKLYKNSIKVRELQVQTDEK